MSNTHQSATQHLSAPLVIFRLMIFGGLTHSSAYAASYSEVYDVVFAPPKHVKSDTARAEARVYAQGKLPQYVINDATVNKTKLRKRVAKTLKDTADFYPRLDKLVHSNGICMAGTWQITKSSKQPYTGMFTKGTTSLFIGRLSVALSETRQGQPRAFGIAGKVFGTLNPHKDVTTANFFVGDVLTGVQRDSVFDAPLTTKPKFGLRFGALKVGLKLAPVFLRADKNPGERSLKPLAAMHADGKKYNHKLITPKHMMLLPIKPKSAPIIKGSDFRTEFQLPANVISPSSSSLTQKGMNQPKKRYFAIYVSETAAYPEDSGWEHIGIITADKARVSYGCDRQLHFSHAIDHKK